MRILLGMSGGLDSTYAANLLKSQGHEVVGAVLVMHPYTETEAARESAREIGIPLVEIDGRERFETVKKNFVSEYLRGRTPNPCVICNREVKFSLLYEYAMENGFDRIATGHYARIVKIGDRYAIADSTDKGKDQSYVLWSLPQHILSSLLLPLSEMKKDDVRARARDNGILAAEREESQEICFIPDNNYAGFIEGYTGESCKEGDFIDESGNVLGRHKGIIHYTVGQRKGLGISLGKRMFVTDISVENNTVTLSDNPNESCCAFEIEDAVFSGAEEPKCGEEILADARVRYLAPLRPAVVTYLGNGHARVVLSVPARAVTPGQSAVFYRDGAVLFGGIIGKIF